MRTVLAGDRPPEIEGLLERRRALGQDLFDEVWEGEYHMVPAPHGQHGQVDFELSGIVRPLAAEAGLTRRREPPEVRLLLPGRRRGASHRRPSGRTVEWFVRGEDGLRSTEASTLFGISAARLAELIDWPG